MSRRLKHQIIQLFAIGLASILPCQGQEFDPSAMSREEWKARVEAARNRIELMRQQREKFIPSQPSLEETAEAASKRVLEDESLLPGDIVSTNRGLFKFRGAPQKPRMPDDFVRIR